MKTHIKVIITTYERPTMLLNLLKSIRKNTSSNLDIHLMIFDDCSVADYSKVFNYLDKFYSNKANFFKLNEHQGKKGYWKIINYAYSLLKNQKFNYVIQLPDDIRLDVDFFNKAKQLYNQIMDPNKVVLNLLTETSRMFKPMWTRYCPHLVKYGNNEFVKTGWLDMCFIATQDFFKILKYEIPGVNEHFAKTKGKSSGVGMYISQTIFKSGASMYQVPKSLVFHGKHKSQMHTELRKKEPLITNNYDKK